MFLAILGFQEAALGDPNSQSKESTYVVAEDGLLVMYASSPLGAASMFFVHYEGVAKSADGSELSITNEQEMELESKIEERLSGMTLSDFRDKSIKQDMKVVFEEDLKDILNLKETPSIQVTQLIISTDDHRDKMKK